MNRDFVKHPRAARLEETVLGVMLCCPEFIEKTKKENLLSEDDFITEFGARLFGIMMGTEDGASFDFTLMNELMSSDEVSRAQKLLIERTHLSNTDAVFVENAAALKKETLRIKNKGSETDGDLLEIIKRRRSEQ